jgi:hypothetical protein
MKRDDPRDNLPLITLEEHSDQIKIDAGIFTGTTYLDKTDMLIAALLAVVLILSVFVVSLYLRWKKVTKRFKQPRTESGPILIFLFHIHLDISPINC